jgi:uncharacterized protein (DUF952 family)
MLIYKIADETAWRAALAIGQFAGSADDLRDGFVHLSAAKQVRGTLAKHFAGRRDLIIAAVETDRLGATLKWEVSRGGDMFPHLYEPLPIAAVTWWRPLPLDANGTHVLPPEIE